MRVSPFQKAPYEPRIAAERASRTATPDRAAAATAADRAPDAAMGPGVSTAGGKGLILCWRTKKTLESFLDYREIKLVNSKGNQP